MPTTPEEIEKRKKAHPEKAGEIDDLVNEYGYDHISIRPKHGDSGCPRGGCVDLGNECICPDPV